MLRGFLSGIFWGTGLSVAVVAVISVLGNNAERVMPSKASEVVVPAGSSFNRDAPEGAATIPSTDKDVTAAVAPSVSAPTLEAPASPSTDTAPAAQPQTGNLPQAPSTTALAPDAPGAVALGMEEPVLPNPQALVPEAPSADIAPGASGSAPPSAPAAPAPQPDQQVLADVGTSQAPALTAEPAPAPVPQPAPQPALTPEPATELAPEMAPGQQKPPVVSKFESDAEIGIVAGVTTNRLPRIGDLSQEVAQAPVRAIPAIDAFSAPFSNPEGKPEMGILLLDVTPRPSLTQLAEFPFTVTFAVDANAPDAAQAMSLYRQAGFEVAMLVRLPETMTPTDAEVSFEVYKKRLPEAVAVVDAQDSGFQVNRPLIGAMMAILKDRGLGLVAYPRGLNTALQVAERQDIPAKLVFRSFDDNNETPSVMRRFLDQAAFRAGQETGVLVVGHARPETIQTLVEWGVQGRAMTVELAPLSVILKAPN